MNPYGQTPDPVLLDEIASGEAEAVAELWRRYLGPIFDFALRVTLDPALAESATAATFDRVQVEVARRSSQLSAASWIFGIARDESLERLRGGREQGPENGNGALATSDERFSRIPSDHAHAGDSQLAAWNWQAARGQRPRDYSLLDLALRHSLPAEEIAEIAALSHS